MASPFKLTSKNPEETASLLRPEMMSPPPPIAQPIAQPREDGSVSFEDNLTHSHPFWVSLLSVLRVMTAAFAITAFILVVMAMPNNYYGYRNPGYIPSAIFDILAFFWQLFVLLRKLHSKFRLIIGVGARDIFLFGRRPRHLMRGGAGGGANDDYDKGPSKNKWSHIFIAVVDLGLLIALLPSWVAILTQEHEHTPAAVCALVVVFEAMLVLFQVIPPLRNMVITSREEEYLYQIRLPTAEPHRAL